MGQIIDTFKEFHRRVPEIVARLNADPALAIRAAVNPLLAFEELGYELTPAVQKKVERFVRFRPDERKHIKALEDQVRQVVGVDFDLDTPAELQRLLFHELRLPRPQDVTTVALPDVMTTGAALKTEKRPAWTDPLRLLEPKHPVFAPLLAYRKLQLKRPGFASRKVYEELKARKRKLPVSRIHIRFPDQPHHEEVNDA